MDRFTIRNLELYHSHQLNAVTLLDVIDKTISPMGGRMLKRWMALPLKEEKAITRLHEVVSYLLEHSEELDKIQTNIRRIGDLERLISKVATLKISPREVVQLKKLFRGYCAYKTAFSK
jgi:DNA mismatch repair protein MutS